uniref:Uncharacterized protein n=1 Tax=uncultured Caudovirales phage TaxID=2100421 RepID=A0A6J5L4X4_9CAUD|nr:hypothetical protein UFOVP114_19 [uncultured Caudovirales phage]
MLTQLRPDTQTEQAFDKFLIGHVDVLSVSDSRLLWAIRLELQGLHDEVALLRAQTGTFRDARADGLTVTDAALEGWRSLCEAMQRERRQRRNELWSAVDGLQRATVKIAWLRANRRRLAYGANLRRLQVELASVLVSTVTWPPALEPTQSAIKRWPELSHVMGRLRDGVQRGVMMRLLGTASEQMAELEEERIQAERWLRPLWREHFPDAPESEAPGLVDLVRFAAETARSGTTAPASKAGRKALDTLRKAAGS